MQGVLAQSLLPVVEDHSAPATCFVRKHLSAKRAPRPWQFRDPLCLRSPPDRPRDCATRSTAQSALSTTGLVQTEAALPSLTDIIPFRPWAVPGTRWRVRPIREDEVPAVCRIQTEAFHEAHGFPPINALLHTIFQAEVLASLRQKLKYADRDNFVCLVAEDRHNPAGVLGVVEVSIVSEKEVLRAMRAAGEEIESYAYVACMAVSDAARRQGIASALLAGAERLVADRWVQGRVLLHVYCDNRPAVELYHRNSYQDVLHDPHWNALWGRRRRTLMCKELWRK
ncbi:hypothetical protein WJX72_007351 [[Myrmecia] bisecta]|uniref:N-acetyltransferase domain-containing protein n=1 Tax=[Myrmecia] bisecta TaxID=41462 RepID=A0AAW1PEV8_9CHLO